MTINEFIKEWKYTHIERIQQESESKKKEFTYKDALKYKKLRTEFDTVMIEYFTFMNKNPLMQNDYYKYVSAYWNTGKKLNPKFFSSDESKLNRYYDKVDKNKQKGNDYNPFNEYRYKKYVLYMMLKLKGLYNPQKHDEVFNVIIKGAREYNPVTCLPSVLRGYLPFPVKEFDISQAYPTFIFQQLGIKPFDVYKKINKIQFNKVLNTHSDVTKSTLHELRDTLRPIYGDRVNEVISEKRFNTKGGLFHELTKIEKKYIESFVEANHLTNYVRLHDGIITLSEVECNILILDDIIEFKVKNISIPTQKPTLKNFYHLEEVCTEDGKKCKTKVVTTPNSYKTFFEQEGYIRVTKKDHDKLTILKNSGKIVRPINHRTDIPSFLKDSINEEYTAEIENQLGKDSVSVINQGLTLMTGYPLKYHRDTSSKIDIPFKNGIARITRDEMKLISYDDVNGFFAENKTLDHDIHFINSESILECPFVQFLTMAIIGRETHMHDLDEKENEHLQAFCSMIGFMISNYKDDTSAHMIMLTDYDADGFTRKGRRGKSLIQKALTFFRPSLTKGGNEYDPTYRHVHADLETYHDIYLLDDLPADFPYTSMYTPVTSTIKKEGKGESAEQIEFKYTPKFLGSSNFNLRYDKDADSTNDRLKEYKFTNYWSIKNKPNDYFKKMFFSNGEEGWDENEWNRFYNFGFFCAQYFLCNGLETIKYDKTGDNFGTYFYQDSILEEAKRIIEYLGTEPLFSVTDFIKEHNQSEIYRFKPEFTIRNAKRYIDAYIEYYKLPFIYSQRSRKWVKT